MKKRLSNAFIREEKQMENEYIEFLADETSFMLREFNQIKTPKEARAWIKSFPKGFERLLLFTVLLQRIKNGV